MATRYQLIDENDNTYDLDNESWKLLTDDFSIDLDIVDRSYQSGADFPGIQRDESKELTFIYDLNLNSDDDFRLEVNTVTKNVRSARVLKDLLTDTQTDILYKEQSIQYDEGGFIRGAKISITFVQLKPFWEDTSYTSSSLSGITDDTIIINNTGFIETPPLITITANEAVTKFLIYITENNGRGVIINDLEFGSNGLDTFVIDCKNGTFLLDGIDRKSTIKQGTGPFNLILGTNTINIESSGSIDITIQYKKRYYI